MIDIKQPGFEILSDKLRWEMPTDSELDKAFKGEGGIFTSLWLSEL